MHKIFANFWLAEVLNFKKLNHRTSPLLCSGNIHGQEIFENVPICVKFAKMSCAKIFCSTVFSYTLILIPVREISIRSGKPLPHTFVSSPRSPMDKYVVLTNSALWWVKCMENPQSLFSLPSRACRSIGNSR